MLLAFFTSLFCAFQLEEIVFDLNREQANAVSVKANDGSIIYQTKYHGPPIEDDPRPADHPELTEPYVAYSPNASVQVALFSIISSDPVAPIYFASHLLNK